MSNILDDILSAISGGNSSTLPKPYGRRKPLCRLITQVHLVRGCVDVWHGLNIPSAQAKVIFDISLSKNVLVCKATHPSLPVDYKEVTLFDDTFAIYNIEYYNNYVLIYISRVG